MRKITALVDHELNWTQPNAFKSVFELRFGGELVATLRFPKFLSTLAQAESEEGCWTFERVGFWKSRIIVRACGADSDLAVYIHNAWKGGGTLELSGGRKVAVAANVWKSTLEFRAEAGETLIHTVNRGVFRHNMTVQMYRKALQMPELPWMVMFGLYLAVMSRRDAARHAGAASA
jgi:hypothetical protein